MTWTTVRNIMIFAVDIMTSALDTAGASNIFQVRSLADGRNPYCMVTVYNADTHSMHLLHEPTAAPYPDGRDGFSRRTFTGSVNMFLGVSFYPKAYATHGRP